MIDLSTVSLFGIGALDSPVCVAAFRDRRGKLRGCGAYLYLSSTKQYVGAAAHNTEEGAGLLLHLSGEVPDAILIEKSGHLKEFPDDQVLFSSQEEIILSAQKYLAKIVADARADQQNLEFKTSETCPHITGVYVKDKPGVWAAAALANDVKNGCFYVFRHLSTKAMDAVREAVLSIGDDKKLANLCQFTTSTLESAKEWCRQHLMDTIEEVFAEVEEVKIAPNTTASTTAPAPATEPERKTMTVYDFDKIPKYPFSPTETLRFIPNGPGSWRGFDGQGPTQWKISVTSAGKFQNYLRDIAYEQDGWDTLEKAVQSAGRGYSLLGLTGSKDGADACLFGLRTFPEDVQNFKNLFFLMTSKIMSTGMVLLNMGTWGANWIRNVLDSWKESDRIQQEAVQEATVSITNIEPIRDPNCPTGEPKHPVWTTATHASRASSIPQPKKEECQCAGCRLRRGEQVSKEDMQAHAKKNAEMLLTHLKLPAWMAESLQQMMKE